MRSSLVPLASPTPGRNRRTPQIRDPARRAPKGSPFAAVRAPTVAPIAAPAAAASRSRVPLLVRASISPSLLSPGFTPKSPGRWTLPPREAGAHGEYQYRQSSARFLRVRVKPRRSMSAGWSTDLSRQTEEYIHFEVSRGSSVFASEFIIYFVLTCIQFVIQATRKCVPLGIALTAADGASALLCGPRPRPCGLNRSISDTANDCNPHQNAHTHVAPPSVMMWSASTTAPDRPFLISLPGRSDLSGPPNS